MPIKLISPNGGHDFTIQPPTSATSTARTLSLPDSTGTLLDTAASPTVTGVPNFSNGIKLGGNETLTTYDEGTWTPTIVGDVTAGVGTYSQQIGNYTKIGKVVTINGFLQWSAHTGTGNMRISNLPFTSSTGSYTPVTIYVDTGLSLTAGNVIQGYITSAATIIVITQYATGGGSAALVPLDTVASLMFNCTYISA